MKEDTLRDLGTQCGILLWIFQEVDHFREFFFFFICTRNICEVDLVLGRIMKLCFTSTEVHR